MSKKTTKKTSKKTTKKTSKKTTKKTTEVTKTNIIESGDFIKVEFTGRIKETGAVFSTSDEDTAKKFNIYDKKSKYGSIPVVAGQSFLLPGLDKKIIGLEVGKAKTIIVPAEEAYGQKQESLIQTFPAKKVKESGFKLKKGEKIRNKNQVGTIISIKQGKVRVDFNHALSGKDLEFEVKVNEIVEDQTKKIFLIVSRYISVLKEADFKYEVNEDNKSISLELSPYMLLTDELQNITLRLISDLRQNFDYQKIEFKFAFDFSEINKEEKKLTNALTAPVSSSENSTDESTDKE